MAPGGDARGSVPRRVACYPPHLHRIQTRQWYDDTEEETNSSNNSNHNSNSNKSHNGVFTIEVPLSELVAWDAVQGGDLAARAARNALRYHDLFCRVIDAHMAAATVEEEETHAAPNHRRSGDEIWHDQRLAQQQQEQNQRQQELAATRASAVNPYAGTGPMEEEEQLQQGQPQNRNANEATLGFPALLMRRYELRILPVGRRGAHPPFRHQQHTASKEDGGDEHAQQVTPVSLRLVRGRHLGSLVTVTGMVVRASDVKPAVTVATYACDACGSELYQVVQNMREFMPVSKCSAQGCNNGGGGRGGGANNAGGSVHLQTRGSKFVKYQELKLQELPNQVPMGHVPRSMPVLCRGELTRQATPGDIVTIDGVFLPQRLAESGYKAMKAGLIATTFLEAQNVTVHKKSYDETASSTSTNMGSSSAALFTAAVRAIATGPDPMGRLASSIAPEIFGHADIKRALLLQLVGGCTRTLPDGMRIRGDVNICLMGDPGVAKSQLLKHVASIAPRGVYTTGKGSSGVGLTAAVTRDLATGEMALEGGALVLADRGE